MGGWDGFHHNPLPILPPSHPPSHPRPRTRSDVAFTDIGDVLPLLRRNVEQNISPAALKREQLLHSWVGGDLGLLGGLARRRLDVLLNANPKY